MAAEGFAAIDFHAFHREELPRRLDDGRGAMAARASREHGSLAFRLESGGCLHLRASRWRDPGRGRRRRRRHRDRARARRLGRPRPRLRVRPGSPVREPRALPARARDALRRLGAGAARDLHRAARSTSRTACASRTAPAGRSTWSAASRSTTTATRWRTSCARPATCWCAACFDAERGGRLPRGRAGAARRGPQGRQALVVGQERRWRGGALPCHARRRPAAARHAADRCAHPEARVARRFAPRAPPRRGQRRHRHLQESLDQRGALRSAVAPRLRDGRAFA